MIPDFTTEMEAVVFVILTEIIMTTFIAWLLSYIIKHRDGFSFRDTTLSVLLLVMMASMLNSLTYYIDSPHNFLNTIISVNFSMIAMTVAIVLILWVAISKQFSGLSGRLVNTFVLLFIWNEISTGLTSIFYVMVYGFSYGINGYLFIAPMAVEMAVLLFLTRPKPVHRNILLSILFMAVFAPTLSGNLQFVLPGTLLTTAAMVGFMIILFEYVARSKRSATAREMRDLDYLFIIFAIMMFGIFFGAVYSRPFGIAWAPYAVAMIAGMAFYFKNSISPLPEGIERRTGWARSHKFLFVVLAASFISEWFAAASLVFEFSATPAAGGFGNFTLFSNLLGGTTTFSAPAVFVDVFYILGAIGNSYWFLIIMGVEMGALVIFQMRKVQWREKRVNLSLALAAYALYTVFGPNFLNPAVYNQLPLWPNVGAFDPLYPFLLLPVVLSYTVYAILAVLFGRRSYCGTLCPSAVMYGGTLGQSMISYNYEAPLSRRHIGSRYKASVLTVGYNLWIIMAIVSAISFYSAGKTHGFTIFGIDTSVFYSFFIWNFLWYIFFIMIPFVGMSPCRRYGWCTTGTFVGFFSRLGLFRLKVHDPQTCVTCPTKDCVQACEVGLGDLPSQFIKQGYFKSSKCVGSGSCVAACPYDNIYFYDIRNFIKEKRKIKN